MKVIAGTGRCGTRWLARTLRDAGITAGHEAVYTPEAVNQKPGLQVDVSWLAITHQAPVDMLVGREPTGCISSLIDCGLFTDADRYTQAVGKVIDLSGDPFVDACRWWVHANTRPARVRWRLDQPDLLPAVLSTIGLFTPGLTPGPRDQHPIGTRTTTVQWEDLPGDVLEVAEQWGWM